jgi:hypothetical protein
MSIDVSIGSESINFANGNFASLWAILDLPREAEGTVTAGDLTARIMLAQTFGTEERPAVRDGNFIYCGMDADYIQHRFGAMLDMLAKVPSTEEVFWY